MVVSTALKITETLNSFTSRPDGIPGVVFRAIRKDGTVLFEGASGVRGIDHKDQPMTTDTVFWIASFTKLLTAVAALQLVEQGSIALDDHAEKYVPEIGKIHILTGFDEENKPILKEPKTKITIRHLLTHTSGLTYHYGNPLTKKFAEINNISNLFANDRKALYCPLAFEPGTDWEYGSGLDWMGQIIEKVNGQTLGAYMQQQIFDPLGIHSTTFELNAEQDARHTHIHMRASDKHLIETDPVNVYGGKVEIHTGGGGAHSTAGDFTTVLIALLNGGEGPNGKRILKKETADLLFLDQSTSLKISLDKPMLPNIPKVFTFGGMVFSTDLPTGRSAGSVWWAGAAGCFWWIDLAKEFVAVFLAQVLPPGDEEVQKCFAACEQLVYAGL